MDLFFGVLIAIVVVGGLSALAALFALGGSGYDK
jgi:hypothetical protein